MKTCISTIKFLVALTVTSFLLTYTISLNIENKFLALDIFWLSNDFAFVISSGTFASILVLLACELQKYFLIKHQTEDSIYSQLFSLYSQITIIHYNIKRQLNDVISPVPYNLIDDISNRGQMFLTSFISVDYTLFLKCNAIRKIQIQYQGKNGALIRSFLQSSIFLKMAMNDDRIDMLRQHKDVLATSNMPKTHLALKKIYDDSAIILSFIEKSLDIIDKECKMRYHWYELKRHIITGEENFFSISLDLYLKQPAICLNQEEK